MYRHRQMQVASHPQTGWTIDQMMNKTFESKGKITPDKSEAKNSSRFFFLSYMAQAVLLKYILFCMYSDQQLRDMKLMKFLSREALETS